MYRIEENPNLFAQQLGIKAGATATTINAPEAFKSALNQGMPDEARFIDTGRISMFDSNVTVYWPEDMDDLKETVNWRIQDQSTPITGFWVVIPKKPVAELRESDLLFDDILDLVLPSGLVDNKTLTFSEEEYGIRFVPRLDSELSPVP